MWGVYFVNYGSNFEWKQNNKHFLSAYDMAGIEDKTKRKETGTTSKETSGLLGEEAAQNQVLYSTQAEGHSSTPCLRETPARWF